MPGPAPIYQIPNTQNNGLLSTMQSTGNFSAITQGLNSFLDSLHQAKQDNIAAEQRALENRTNKTLLDWKLDQGGVNSNPNFDPTQPVSDTNSEFNVSASALKRAMMLQQIERANKDYDTLNAVNAKMLPEQGKYVTGLPWATSQQQPQSQLPSQQVQPQSGITSMSPSQYNTLENVGSAPAQGMLPQSMLPQAQPPSQLPASAPPPSGQLPQAPAANPVSALRVPGLGESPEYHGKVLENQIKERDLSDKTKNLPAPQQEAVKQLVTSDLETVAKYNKALNNYSIVADTKRDSTERKDAAIGAVNAILDSKNPPRGKVYEDLTAKLDYFNKTEPGKLVGRDYDAMAKSIKNSLQGMQQEHQLNQKQQAQYGAPPPKGTGLLEPIPGNKSNAHSQAVDWAKANPRDPRSKTILQMNGM